jgi:hypothetical protein
VVYGETIMKETATRLAAIAGLVALCFASPVLGQTTVSITGAPSTGSFGDGIADPYDGTVVYDGVTLANNGLIVCDDYKDNVVVPETWNATALQASQLPTLTTAQLNADTFFGDTVGLNGYAAEASLVAQVLATPNSNPTKQADLSAAIWYITDSGAGGIAWSSLDPQAQAYVTAAEAPFGGSTALTPDSTSASAIAALEADTNLWIFTPNPTTGYTQNAGDGEPQEMWVSTPEGGAALLYLLLAGASCFGAMFFNARNRLGNRASA